MSTKFDPGDHARWHAFLDALMPLVKQHLGDDAMVLLSAQFGTMLSEDSEKHCAIATNLPTPCVVLNALDDVREEVEEAHEHFHNPEPDDDDPTPASGVMLAEDDEVPPEIRQMGEALAKSLGMDMSAVRFAKFAVPPKALPVVSETLSAEDEDLVRQFHEALGGLPEAEETGDLDTPIPDPQWKEPDPEWPGFEAEGD